MRTGPNIYKIFRKDKIFSEKIDTLSGLGETSSKDTTKIDPRQTLAENYSSSCVWRTHRATRFLNSFLSSRHILAASILAGLSSFGSASIEITDTKMVWKSQFDAKSFEKSKSYLDCMHGEPTLRSLFVTILIITRIVKDRNTNLWRN